MSWFPHLANGHDMINLTSWVAGVLHNTPRAPGTVSDAQSVLSSISGHLSGTVPSPAAFGVPLQPQRQSQCLHVPFGCSEGLSPEGPPARGKPCRNPGSPGENELDPHACTSRAHRSGGDPAGARERERRGERAAGQLAGAALGPARGRPHTCPGAPGPSSLPQPVPALAARTRSSAGYSSAAASISSLSRRCCGVAP